jgi:hypothetical protein
MRGTDIVGHLADLAFRVVDRGDRIDGDGRIDSAGCRAATCWPRTGIRPVTTCTMPAAANKPMMILVVDLIACVSRAAAGEMCANSLAGR